MAYDWPGNARELAGVIVHAMLLADTEEIGPQCVVDALRSVRQSTADADLADKDAGPAEEKPSLGAASTAGDTFPCRSPAG